MATMSEKEAGHGIVIDPLSAAFLVGPELRNFDLTCLVTEHDITHYMLTTTQESI
jgi:Trk K+ transport system NAD-binding subunit